MIMPIESTFLLKELGVVTTITVLERTGDLVKASVECEAKRDERIVFQLKGQEIVKIQWFSTFEWSEERASYYCSAMSCREPHDFRICALGSEDE